MGAQHLTLLLRSDRFVKFVQPGADLVIQEAGRVTNHALALVLPVSVQLRSMLVCLDEGRRVSPSRQVFYFLVHLLILLVHFAQLLGAHLELTIQDLVFLNELKQAFKKLDFVFAFGVTLPF